MQAPSTWTELAQLIGEPERGNLDFKRELASDGNAKTRANENLASDVAAMSVDGGLILIGVDEDETSCAASLPGVPLQGLSERIAQVCGSRIFPPLSPAVSIIDNPDNPGNGVVVISIAPSRQAPHYSGQRFLGRSEQTNRHLTEAEIERLYRLRHSRRSLDPQTLRSGWPQPMLFSLDHEQPEDATWINVSVTVAPHEGITHPDDPNLLPALRTAYAVAVQRAGDIDFAHALQALRLGAWEPHEAFGWRAVESTSVLIGRPATYRYVDGAVRLTFSLDTASGAQQYDVVQEWEIAALTTGWLAIAGTLYSHVPASGPFTVAADVNQSRTGISGSRPIVSAHRAAGFGGGARAMPASYGHATITSANELLTDPSAVASRLLGRWVASFDGRVGWDEFKVNS